MRIDSLENKKAYIGLVTDLTTQQVDGTITKGGTILVTGQNINIANDNQNTEDAIFLINHDRVMIRIDTPLKINKTDLLKFDIPASIDNGEYTLYIKKQLENSIKKVMHHTQALVYMLKLNIID